MSRIAKNPINIPANVQVNLNGQQLLIKGSKGQLELVLHEHVSVKLADNQLTFAPTNQAKNWAMAGTTRALVQNMVLGVSEGFTKTLEINGVGYRAAANGKVVNLSLGFSHPVDYVLPDNVTAETPRNTTIVLKSIDKQRLGQVAAEIRAFRPPEPYKGKGIRYSDETVYRKEAKKK